MKKTFPGNTLVCVCIHVVCYGAMFEQAVAQMVSDKESRDHRATVVIGDVVAVADEHGSDDDQQVSITVDGQIFAIYRTGTGTRPTLWPIFGPDQRPLTRGYPMTSETTDKTANENFVLIDRESDDHPHHRSLWFAHGEVNGHDFWTETKTKSRVVHREFLDHIEGQRPMAVDEFATRNDWMSSENKRELTDTRRFRFFVSEDYRIIDLYIRLEATDGSVHFGDTKEGTLGLRLVDTMRVDANMGGQINNEHSQVDSGCWGRIANWVDYSGPNDDDAKSISGVTIMCHPASFAAPSRWHVRDYGLFAHNPFGTSQFKNEKPTSVKNGGGYLLPKGDSIKLIYRIVLHSNGFDRDMTEELWQEFASSEPFVKAK